MMNVKDAPLLNTVMLHNNVQTVILEILTCLQMINLGLQALMIAQQDLVLKANVRKMSGVQQ
jgi:hypothetical protein